MRIQEKGRRQLYSSYGQWRSRGVFFYVLLVLAGLVLENVGIGLLIPLLDTLGEDEANVVGFGRLTLNGSVGVIFALISAAIVTRAVVELVVLYTGSRLTNEWAHQIRTRLHALIYESGSEKPAVIDETGTGEYLNLLTKEAWHAGEYHRARLRLGARILALLVYGLMMVYISARLTLLLLVVVVPVGVLALVVNSRVRSVGRLLVTHHGAQHSSAVASMLGRFTILTFGLNDRFQVRFENQSRAVRDLTIRVDTLGASVPQVLSVLMIPVLVGVLLVGRTTGLSINWIVAFLVVLYRTVPQATGVISSAAELSRHRAGLETVERHLGRVPPPPIGASRIDAVRRIELRDIEFSYRCSQPIMTDVDATLMAGNAYYVRGSSGAGKSTLLALILGFLEPDDGLVSINGEPLSSLDPTSYRSHVGYAGQQSVVFEESLDWNIYLDRSIDVAAKAHIEADLGIDEIIERLPHGRETLIGQGGVGLSGGQQQRIQVGRAICNRPSLLILDEATSELDRLAEARVLLAVRKYCPDAITLIVSHRDSNTAGKTDLTVELVAAMTESEPAFPYSNQKSTQSRLTSH